MSGFVYAIECNGRIKIGYSEKPERRFSKVASDAPFPCVLLGYWPGSSADELEIQQKFQSIRVHGEWFATTELLLEFIANHTVPPVIAVKPPIGLEPAASIISKCGGITALSKMAGVSVHAVMRWRTPRERGGTGGVVPHWHVPAILKAARDKGIDVRASDFAPREEEAA